MEYLSFPCQVSRPGLLLYDRLMYYRTSNREEPAPLPVALEVCTCKCLESHCFHCRVQNLVGTANVCLLSQKAKVPISPQSKGLGKQECGVQQVTVSPLTL